MEQAQADDPAAGSESAERVIAATRNWVEKAVIGLRLCPFAASPYLLGLIRYRVSEQQSPEGLAEELTQELEYLAAADPLRCETSLLIHPHVLGDFLDYNQFLDRADGAVAALGLAGELQIASFHPLYQFAGSASSDVENSSNRSPYPMLHLLRESSVKRATATFPGVDEIGSRNMATLRELGAEGLRKLLNAESAALRSPPAAKTSRTTGRAGHRDAG
jgi:hypothetical protein